jgi:hypothetical protein
VQPLLFLSRSIPPLMPPTAASRRVLDDGWCHSRHSSLWLLCTEWEKVGHEEEWRTWREVPAARTLYQDEQYGTEEACWACVKVKAGDQLHEQQADLVGVPVFAVAEKCWWTLTFARMEDVARFPLTE